MIKKKLYYTVAFLLLILWELIQYFGYILISPITSFVYELSDAVVSFPCRAIRYAWVKYTLFMKTGIEPSNDRPKPKERLN